MTTSLLRTEALRLHYRTQKGVLRAVDGVDLVIKKNRTLAILGESGCGKSSLARAILRLLPRNVAVHDGSLFLDGVDIMPLDEERFRKEVRWTKISMVPQASMNSLNPVVRIGEQVAEPLMVHRGLSKQAALDQAREQLKRVGLPEDFVTRYPFELSGGMRQRTALAMALITSPPLVILDEPTSALDVLTQANILNVLKTLKRDRGTSFVLITHDIGTSSEIADDVAVIYAGQIVEHAPAEKFYIEPLHPYSQKLMASVPRIHEKNRPESIPGEPPSLIDPPAGCRFADRCPFRFDKCAKNPPLLDQPDGRQVRCWLHLEGAANV